MIWQEYNLKMFLDQIWHLIFSPAFSAKPFFESTKENTKPTFTFAMRHWEKINKKDPRRTDDRDFRQQDQEQKKKKLKPIEKIKYRANGYFEADEEV